MANDDGSEMCGHCTRPTFGVRVLVCEACDKTIDSPTGLTLDHFQELLDQAAIRRVRSFTLKTTMAGVAVELTAQFEPPERKKDQHE